MCYIISVDKNYKGVLDMERVRATKNNVKVGDKVLSVYSAWYKKHDNVYEDLTVEKITSRTIQCVADWHKDIKGKIMPIVFYTSMFCGEETNRNDFYGTLYKV